MEELLQLAKGDGAKATTHLPDILDCLANLSSDEVFTPPRVANLMLGLLPDEVWRDPTLRWLDPCSKSGVFLREVARRLHNGLGEAIPDECERREHIYRNMLYGIAITEITALVSRRTLYGCKEANLNPYSVVTFDDRDGNIRFPVARHNWDKKRCASCGISQPTSARDDTREIHAHPFLHSNIAEIFDNQKEVDDMRFDVIMGNPPYQMEIGDGQRSAVPLYHRFIEQAKAMEPRYCTFVIPARWYVGGKGLSSFRSNMLRDSRIAYLVDFPDIAALFDGVDVAGGGCYFLWDRDHSGNCCVIPEGNRTRAVRRSLNEFDIFLRDSRDIALLNKVQRKIDQFNHSTMETAVRPRNPYGLESNASSHDTRKVPDDSYDTLLMAKDGEWYIARSRATKNSDTIDLWKVVVSKVTTEHGGAADADGRRQVIAGNLRVLPPQSVCTETYLVVDIFTTRVAAENLQSYITTRFFRFLLSLRVVTQNISRECFAFVPRLDMDTEWTDSRLYDYFNLDAAERAHIESRIKPMSSANRSRV